MLTDGMLDEAALDSFELFTDSADDLAPARAWIAYVPALCILIWFFLAWVLG